MKKENQLPKENLTPQDIERFVNQKVNPVKIGLRLLALILAAALLVLATSCSKTNVEPDYSGSYHSSEFCSGNIEVLVEKIEGSTYKIFGSFTVEINDGKFEGTINNGVKHEGQFSEDGTSLEYAQTLSGFNCSATLEKK